MNEPQSPDLAGKPKALTSESYDFDEVSDICDFGYVLAPRDDAKTRSSPKAAE